jgi:hypothetical protein
MSIKAFALPVLAAGAAFIAVRWVSARVAGSRDARPLDLTQAVSKAKPGPQAIAGAVARNSDSKLALPQQQPAPTTAFWDAGTESDPDSIARSMLASEPEDAYEPLGLRWVSSPRLEVTQYDDEEDDPAEVAADSVSMISEASRMAALMYAAEQELDLDEDADDERA